MNLLKCSTNTVSFANADNLTSSFATKKIFLRQYHSEALGKTQTKKMHLKKHNLYPFHAKGINKQKIVIQRFAELAPVVDSHGVTPSHPVTVEPVRLERVVDIETKAGMKLFEGIKGSNFLAQCFNSLKKVTSLKDYKVFLNEELLEGISNYTKKYKTSVINALEKFEGGAFFDDAGIKALFGSYFNKTIPDASTLKILLEKNDNWFEEIFKNDLI